MREVLLYISEYAIKSGPSGLGSIISSARTPYLRPEHLLLLPGLDGTGELFVHFIAALPESWTAVTVTYPTDRFLTYAGLRPFVAAAAPQLGRFVLVAESVSTPLALWYAATKPQNLVAVIICAGFVRSPVLRWSGIVKGLAKPCSPAHTDQGLVGNGGGPFFISCVQRFRSRRCGKRRPEGGAGRRDQTYQVPAVLIPSEAEIASDQLARKE